MKKIIILFLIFALAYSCKLNHEIKVNDENSVKNARLIAINDYIKNEKKLLKKNNVFYVREKSKDEKSYYVFKIMEERKIIANLFDSVSAIPKRSFFPTDFIEYKKKIVYMAK